MNAPADRVPGLRPKVKCLLVDDKRENLIALGALLRGDDVEVLEAHSGPEALELLLANDVALAFLDVQMPDIDGFQLAELMRGSERTRHIPIIFVTAGALDHRRVFKGYESGAVDFLHKPIEPHILRNKADVFFQLHRQKLQLAAELHERTETLRLNEMFVAVLGHDLRNPLSAVVNSAALLERKLSDPGNKVLTGRILASGMRMSRMINDMLDLARARLGGGIPVTRARGDLGSVAQRVVQEQRDAFPGRAIEVEQRGDLTGEWDIDRLAQAASNLIANALQHGEAREPVRVALDGTQEHEVVLAVSNAGSIAQELLPRIFDPFRGGDREARGRDEGLGLGLYIVRQIVEAHGGLIEVQADEPAQTVFRARIPRY